MSNRRKTITSVDRALSLLDVFDSQNPELGITELARLTGLPKSTVAGLVYTLAHRGYLIQDSETRKYRLGLRLAERARIALHQFDFVQLTRPHLEGLKSSCNKSVNLGVLRDTEVIIIDHISAFLPGSATKIGKHLPVYATAMGKAILSALTPHQLTDLLDKLRFSKFTPQTIDNRNGLLKEISRTRQRGFAFDAAESAPGIFAIAAPVFNWQGQVTAAVSLAMPYQPFPPKCVARWGKAVSATAANISQDMGLADRVKGVP